MGTFGSRVRLGILKGGARSLESERMDSGCWHHTAKVGMTHEQMLSFCMAGVQISFLKLIKNLMGSCPLRVKLNVLGGRHLAARAIIGKHWSRRTREERAEGRG